MTKVNDVYLLLGSNIEPRLDYINRALAEIKNRVGLINDKSSLFESEAHGFVSNTKFINQVLKVKSIHTAEDVLTVILDIEKGLGRKRQYDGYSSRTIDIDILYYNEDVFNLDQLVIPHPRLHRRRFTLLPLNEIASDYIHPIINRSNEELLEECKDLSEVNKYKNEEL
ncbi:MAG: 2-amino-4-hydroxy-6-hydroxymethyldihydropteridine diphosphokinase [Bacteroidales bacterium]|jgi:2-amino-4-hydroxy-6-hydroxymethyldihydropteridine diphosphokinase|nr:2-amino-4-hydroxy-6-hydroxymethyldihydropteridine diphosphokinase [Bacteroidales bacterium]MDG1901752.1 2-amino-4-hydroxy-6-hydroxymethyldihydropteridine diphosphokinase [Bacteroidales bacterium]MDG2081326.1 2-amino-4-hydroxy-6-hydroxymethyldihydropteridine diphosphokinase [Bacteroidales bacterium]